MNPTVLIIDDSAILRLAIRKACVMAGVDPERIREAANGKEGIEAMRSESPDLVLLDLQMPVMNGEEFAIAWSLEPRWRETRVVVVSTEANKERLDRLRAIGVRDYLPKPFEPESLVRFIKGHTGGACHETH
jgi:hypothetical protein